MTKLAAFFNRAKEVGAKTILKKMRTESGVKDTVQEHFLDKLFASYKGKHGTIRLEETFHFTKEQTVSCQIVNTHFRH